MAGLSAACWLPQGTPRQRRMQLEDLAERYVRLTLRLAQHQPSLVESWLGPADWRPGPREPVAKIRDEIGAASQALVKLTPPPDQADRFRYLLDQLSGLVVAARRLSGESMRFAQEAREAFRIVDLDRFNDEASASAAREELERRLDGRGPLHQRYAAFRAEHAVPLDRVLPAFDAAIDACRDRIRVHIPLPDTERVDIESARELGLEARASYPGDFRTHVAIDPSGAPDIARLVWLAAHETYPGHHVQHVLADRDCVRLRGWHERALHPAFGRHLLCAEGAAEAGASLLLAGDAFEEICHGVSWSADLSAAHVADLVAVHRAATTLDGLIPIVAKEYLDGELSAEDAAARLTEDALVADAHRFLQLIERQRTRLLSYPIGRRSISAVLAAVPAAQRWRRLGEIATTLIE